MKENLRRKTSNQIGKVLVVNSDPEIVYILEVNFTHANFGFISADNEREALNIVYRDKPDVVIIDTTLPDIDGTELCHKLKESETTNHIPLIIISAKNEKDGRTVKAIHGADSYITKPFTPNDIIGIVKEFFKDEVFQENISSATGLLSRTQIDSEISQLIRQGKTFTAIYTAMDDLRLFNKVYGYNQGDHIIKLLAGIVTEAVRMFGNPDDTVGHFGGDEFVVLSTPWKARTICRRIIADYNRQVKALYSDQRLNRGYKAFEEPIDQRGQSPNMNLHIAVVTNQEREFMHHLEVSDAAAEQMEYLKRFQGSKSYFDLHFSDRESDATLMNRNLSSINREEAKAMQTVLAWLDFIIKDLDIRVSAIEDSLVSIERLFQGDIGYEQQNSLKIIHESTNKIHRMVEGLVYLTRAEWLMAGVTLEEVRIRDTIDWVVEQLRETAEQREVEIDIEGVRGIGILLVDRNKLCQGLLYILRSEIQSSQPGDQISIRVAENIDDFIEIRISNANRYIHPQILTMLFHNEPEGLESVVLRNEFYPARISLESLGGEIKILSDKEKGTTYSIIIPKKWQSIHKESNALQLAVDISRKEARAELVNIRNDLVSSLEQVPESLSDRLENLQGKMQELGVLCNRSLFLADELNTRLENQQDRLLRQETEEVASIEAIVDICREIAISMKLDNIFDINNARNTAKYSLAIAREMRLSEAERQVLYYATLLKDLGLVLSPQEMVERTVVDNIETARVVQSLYKNIRKILSTIPFISSVLVHTVYRYERYDGKSSSRSIENNSIPLGSRILAIADTFEAMLSGRFAYAKLSPKLAVQRIVNDSGTYFDPHVVKAFLKKWKRREIRPTSKKF